MTTPTMNQLSAGEQIVSRLNAQPAQLGWEPQAIITALDSALKDGKVVIIHYPERAARITPQTRDRWSLNGHPFFKEVNGQVHMNDGTSNDRPRYRAITGCLIEVKPAEEVQW